MRGLNKQTLEEGYNKFVIKNPEGCWGWKGCAANPGYGQFRFGMKRERAHRASWIIHFGEIPKGKHVLHVCDNRICSNPKHLFIGEMMDNVWDMIKKGRSPVLGKKGSKNPNSKLNEEMIKHIRSSELSKKELAKKYNVHQQSINNILSGKSWKEAI